MKHLQDLPVLILGLGASGLAMARWCARQGALVTVADTREAPALRATLDAEWPAVRFIGGPLTAALIEGTTVRAVYRSPGLTPAAIAPVTDAARASGVPVGGELDLFAQALRDLAVADVPAGGGAALLCESAVVAPQTPVEVETSVSAAAPMSVSVHVTALAAQTASIAPIASAAPTPPDMDDVSGVPVSMPAKVSVSVHGAAREAAEFVARIAALAASTPTALSTPGDDAAGPAFVVPQPTPAQGYKPAVLAITGTNGKTTVTALTGQLVERAGKTVAVAGNIGPTLLDTLSAHLDADTLPEVWVLELSSFQLDGVQNFEPTAAVVLNLSQDHLDWHGDMDAYVAAKARIFGTRGLMILNRDDAAVLDMLPPPVRVKLQRPQSRSHITFGAGLPQRPADFGIERINGMTWLVRALEADETIKRKRGAVLEQDIVVQRLMPADALRIRGQHNALNALAALALASAAGCALGAMLYGLREYRGEPHRVESVAIIDQVEYFDDSKGTNVGATVAALNGVGAERRIVAILGGEGKGQDFSPLSGPVRQFARAVVLIGRDAPVIEAALAATGIAVLHAASMVEAVQLAAQRAHPGDAVLLSPACASFDMFRDYAHRAQAFCDAVEALVAEPADASGAAT